MSLKVAHGKGFMKKIAFLMLLVFSTTGFSSCAFRSAQRNFGPYSEAESFYKKGNYPEAIEKYQEYLAGHPQGNMAAISEYYIAKSYAASGDTVKAREAYERVVQLYPETSWAEFSKDQLDRLQGAPQT